jgi:hypothetical protein
MEASYASALDYTPGDQNSADHSSTEGKFATEKKIE